jgi:hypothetical protein
MKKKTVIISILTILAMSGFTGCGSDSDDNANQVSAGMLKDSQQPFLISEKPVGEVDLVEVFAKAKPGDPVLVTGRIGGTRNPISEDFAGFILTDESVYFCDEGGDEGHCPTPWDACCEDPDKLASSRAFVQFVADNGNPLQISLKDATGLAENQTVIVRGTVAPESTESNFLINAEGFYIQ